jgi:hypothetical protein
VVLAHAVITLHFSSVVIAQIDDKVFIHDFTNSCTNHEELY